MTKQAGSFAIRWHDAGVEPRHPPDPRYPHGVDLDMTEGRDVPSCFTLLPHYPAKRVGAYLIECKTCGLTVAVSTAGRPDDPKSVRVLCRVLH